MCMEFVVGLGVVAACVASVLHSKHRDVLLDELFDTGNSWNVVLFTVLHGLPWLLYGAYCNEHPEARGTVSVLALTAILQFFPTRLYQHVFETFFNDSFAASQQVLCIRAHVKPEFRSQFMDGLRKTCADLRITQRNSFQPDGLLVVHVTGPGAKLVPVRIWVKKNRACLDSLGQGFLVSN